MIREYNIGKNWEKTVVISLWVQIFLLPVMAWHYYQYPLYGMFLNFLVLPLVPVLMIAGIMILLTGGFLPLAAGTAAKVGHVILGYYKWICEGSLKLPGAVRIMGRPGPGQILGHRPVGIWYGFIEMPEVGHQKDPEKYINLIFQLQLCSQGIV